MEFAVHLAVHLIEVTQLDVLGFNESYRKLTIAIIMVVLVYLICKPVIVRLVEREHITFLTYLIASLFITVLALCIAIIDEALDNFIIGLRAVALFGFLLIFSLLYQFVKAFIKRRLLRQSP